MILLLVLNTEKHHSKVSSCFRCLEVQTLEGRRGLEEGLWSLWSCFLQGRAKFLHHDSVLCGGSLSLRDVWRRTGKSNIQISSWASFPIGVTLYVCWWRTGVVTHRLCSLIGRGKGLVSITWDTPQSCAAYIKLGFYAMVFLRIMTMTAKESLRTCG